MTDTVGAAIEGAHIVVGGGCADKVLCGRCARDEVAWVAGVEGNLLGGGVLCRLDGGAAPYPWLLWLVLALFVNEATIPSLGVGWRAIELRLRPRARYGSLPQRKRVLRGLLLVLRSHGRVTGGRGVLHLSRMPK